MSEEMIEPCPFCGSADVEMLASNGVPHGQRGAGGTRHVECNACYATGPAEPPPRDGRAWNTRAYNPNERLREALEENERLESALRIEIWNQRMARGGKQDAVIAAINEEIASIKARSALSPLPQGED